MKQRYFLVMIMAMIGVILFAIIGSDKVSNSNNLGNSSGFSFDYDRFANRNLQETKNEMQSLDRHCGIDPQSAVNEAFNKEILKQVQHDVEVDKIEATENTVPQEFSIYDGEERVIGYRPQKPVHNPSDEFFYLLIDSAIPLNSQVFLEYELYGVEDNTQVSRSINEQPIFGGYFAKQNEKWTHQSEQINPALLHDGVNTFRFSIGDNVKYFYKIKDLHLRVVSDEADLPKDRQLIVNQPTTAYYYRQYGYIEGFVAGADYDKAEIRVNGQKIRSHCGEFENIVGKNDKNTVNEGDVLPSHSPWTALVEAIFPDGEVLSIEVRFEKPVEWDYLTGFNPDVHHISKEVFNNNAFHLDLGAVSLRGDSGSLRENTTLSITALRSVDIPRLNPGMVNVTGDNAAYRFLPHGSTFDKPLRVTMGYDSTKIPKGHYAQEIRTYYYDEERRSWVALHRDLVDKENQLICSYTMHFTDMINAIVKAPEMPEAQEFTPTSLKELEAANPSSGIQMMQPPTANSQGTASLSYPINVPAGRQGLQPNLAVSYSSEAANGLLGMGWDMQIPSITVDNRWGVPRYESGAETETYLYNGEELLPSARLESSWHTPRYPSGTQFYPRVEGGFEQIKRYGDSPDSYFWIVTDKQGTQYYYGTYDGKKADMSVLLKTEDDWNIAQWPLCLVKDIHGNTMQYCYTIRHQKSEYQDSFPLTSPVTKDIYLGQQLWLDAISYTGYEDTAGSYKVVFSSDNCSLDSARRIGCDELGKKTISSKAKDLDNNSRAVAKKDSNETSFRGGGSDGSPCKFKIHKIDQYGKNLKDIEFNINGMVVFTDNDGNTPIFDISDNDFTIEEIVSNCCVPIAPIQIQMMEDSECDIEDFSPRTSILPRPQKMFINGEFVNIITIKNNCGCDDDEEEEEEEGNCSGNIDVYVCMVNAWCNDELITGANAMVEWHEGEPDPKFTKNTNPPPRKISNNQPIYNKAMANSNGCWGFSANRCKKYYVVATPPAHCEGNDPVVFSFRIDQNGVISWIRDVNGASLMGRTVIGINGSPPKFIVPIGCMRCTCEDCPSDTLCVGGYSSSTCLKKVDLVSIDSCLEDMDMLDCFFDIFRINDPQQTVYSCTTGDMGYSPLFVSCNEWYQMTWTDFGYGYQNDSIIYEFMVDSLDNIHIRNVSGVHPSKGSVIAKRHSNGYKEILTPPLSTILHTKQVRTQIVDNNGNGVPNFSFLLCNTHTGLVEGGIRTTNTQGYTPLMTLVEGVVYHITEVDAVTYYNPNNAFPYTDFIPNWQNLIAFDIWVESCTLDLKTSPNQDSVKFCDDFFGRCTFTYTVPNRPPTNDIRVKKIDPAGNVIANAVFRLTNTSNGSNTTLTTKNNGVTASTILTASQSYVLQEDSVPSDYILDTTRIDITVDNNGNISISSQMTTQYDSANRIITITNKKYCTHAYFRVKKQDAKTKEVLGGASIALYKGNNKDKTAWDYTQWGTGLTNEMTMECGQTYTIDEFDVPTGYQSQYAAYVTIQVGNDGSMKVIKSEQLDKVEQDENGVWLFVFNNHKDTTPPLPMNLKDGCSSEYAYDNTINARNGFRQSSKEKLSKIVVFYNNECVRSYTFCYGEDFYGRAQLREISQWGSEDSAAAYTHTLEYYEDVDRKTRKIFASDTIQWTGLNRYSEDETGRRIAKKLRNFFLKDFVSPSVLGGSRTWSTGINAGVDLGFGPVSLSKDLSVGLYTNGGISTSKGKTTLIDIDGDGLPDRVYSRLEWGGNKVYYCLQKPDRSGFDTAVLLKKVTTFLEDFSDNASLGLQVSAIVHGGIQKSLFGNSWTNVYFADMSGNGLIDLVNSKGVKNIGQLQPPPKFKFSDCLFPEVTQEKKEIRVDCDTNFHFEAEPYKRDRSGELRYDVVRVWEATLDCKQLPDLTYSICAPVRLAYDSIAMENFCGEPDSVIVSIECYRKGTNEHILLWSDVIADSDTTIHKPWANCNLNIYDAPPLCPIMLRKTNHRGKPLGNVIFKLNDGTQLVTDANKDGRTPAFYLQDPGDCIEIEEIQTLPHCYVTKGSIVVCKDESESCNITAYNKLYTYISYRVADTIIDGERVHLITIGNDCNENPLCLLRLRKIDQNGKVLENIKFKKNNGETLITDKQGFTPLFYILEGGCVDIQEMSTLPNCDLLTGGFQICADENCTIRVNPFGSIEQEWINGVLITTITVLNHCEMSCAVRLRKVDQYNNLLQGVKFEVDNRGHLDTLITDNQGLTSIFYPVDNNCVNIQELFTLTNCNLLATNIQICAGNQCNNINVMGIPPSLLGGITQQIINGVLVKTITIINNCQLDCAVRLRKVNQTGKVLQGVQFEVDNQGHIDTLITDNQGFTPIFYPINNNCVSVQELSTLVNCNLLTGNIQICANNQCNNITVTPASGVITQEMINGVLVKTITITNNCQLDCAIRLRKVDQNGKVLQGVQFEVDNQGIFDTLITDNQGFTSIFNTVNNNCVNIQEISTLANCDLLTGNIQICANNQCNNITVTPASGVITQAMIDGVLVKTITIKNQCEMECAVRLRKVDQDNNPLEGVIFEVDKQGNLETIVTDNQGFTSIFNTVNNNCVNIQEISTLPNCNLLDEHIQICVDNQCNIQPIEPIHVFGGVTQQTINGVLVKTITIKNKCGDSRSGSSDSKFLQANKEEPSSRLYIPDEASTTLSGLKLCEGDLLFFRVRPYNNGVKKKVIWDPAVIPDSRILSKTEYLDENDRIFGGGNKASESQLLQGNPQFQCQIKGEATIESAIKLSHALTDAVTFEIWKDKVRQYYFTIPAGQIGTQNWTQTYDVDSNTIFEFKVLSQSNVNMHEIKWYPKLYYHYIVHKNDNAPSGMDTIYTIVEDDSNNNVRLLEYEIVPYYDFYHNVIKLNSKTLHKIHNPSIAGAFVTYPVNSLHINSPYLFGDAYLTIKQKGKLQYAKNVSITGGTITLGGNVTLSNDPNTPVYISCYINNPLLAGYIQSCSVKIDNKPYQCIVYTKNIHHAVFGERYGGWGQFLYQTDSIPNKDKYALMDMNKIKWLNTLSTQNAQSIKQYVDTTRLGDSIGKIKSFADDSVKYSKRMATIRESLFVIPMFNDPANNGHVGYYANTFIRGADMNIGGIPCPDFEEEDPCQEDEEALADIPEDDENAEGRKSAKGDDGGGTRGVKKSLDPKKTSSSNSVSLTAGASIFGFSIGANASYATMKQKNDLMDLNGDGIPDLIQKGEVFYALSSGVWEDSPKCKFGEKTHHLSSNISAGASFTASPGQTVREVKNHNKGKEVVADAAKNGNNLSSIQEIRDEIKKLMDANPVGENLMDVDNALSFNMNWGWDITEYTLMDINGDGLPDRIYNKGSNVSLNLGYSFEDAKYWNLQGTIGKNTSWAMSQPGMGQSYSIGNKSYSGGLGGTISNSNTKEMFIDMNADGLPDKVKIAADDTLYIYYNTGCGYNAYRDTVAIKDLTFYQWNKTTSKSGNFGLTIGSPIPPPIPVAKLSGSAGADASFSMSASNIQFMDMDGDGYTDLVFAPDDTTLAVYYSRLGRTGLLKTVTNPLGGTYEMAYHKTPANVYHSRKWVMDTVKINDNLPGDGIDLMMTSYQYDTGYYDRREKAFYGFAKVTEKHHNTGVKNNPTYRTITRYYFNDAYYRKGLPMFEATQEGDSGALYITTRNVYSTHNVSNGDYTSKYITLDSTVTCFFEGTGSADIRQVQTYQYDLDNGNVIQKTETSTDMPQIVMNITYHDDPGNYRISIPKTVEIQGYRKRTTVIDNNGKGIIKEIRDYYTTNNSLSTKMEYDNYGNCTRMIYPNHSYKYTYDDKVHTYPVSVTDTFKNSSYAQNYDFRFGVPLKVIDKAGNKMWYTLDQFGRIRTITSPKEIDLYGYMCSDSSGVGQTRYDTIPKEYTIKYTYYSGSLKDTVPYAAFTQHYDATNPENDIETYTYCDGLGRIVQTKRDAEIDCGSDSAKESMVVSGKVYYDAFGRTVKTKYPTVECKTQSVFSDTSFYVEYPYCPNHKPGNPRCVYYGGIPSYNVEDKILIDNLEFYKGAEDPVAASTASYDIMDRPLVQTAPDNTFVSYSYGFGSDSKRGYRLFQTKVTDQNNHTSLALANVGKQQFEVKPAGHEAVWFTYNDIGDLEKVQGEDFKREYQYDGLGRKTLYQEDSLKETYTYNGVNLTGKTMYWNENGKTQDKTINYVYDFNRLKTVQSSEYQTAIVYKYNSKTGKLDTIIDQSGMQTFQYGSMGEVTKQTRIYALPFMEQNIAISTEFEYDSWGRTLNMTYPDGEKLTYNYDYGGQLKSMRGVKDTTQIYHYVNDIQYDKFGAKTFIQYGNNAETRYTYDPLNLRLILQEQTTFKPYSAIMAGTGGETSTIYLPATSNISYTYDAKGNITRIQTTAPIDLLGRTDTELSKFANDQYFEYDTADQLDTAYAYNHNNGALYNVKMVYENYGRIKTSNTTFTDPQTSITQTFDNKYAYNTVDAPSNSFAPISANDTINFKFGVNGSMRERTTPTKTEFYHFNAFDQMKAYSDDGIKYGYYGYDDAGQRMYKVTLKEFVSRTNAYGGRILEAEKMMLYPNGYINIDQHGNYTKHYYADAARVASKIGSGYEDTISTGIADTTHLLATMKNELGILLTGDTVDNIRYEFEPITHLQGDTTSSYEDALFFYHGNHLSSTQLITDNSGSISQAVLYTPHGLVIAEYRADWKLDTIPRFLFTGMERDDESGLDYMNARYYKDGTFISRDLLFRKYFWMSPYAYSFNNPVRYIDPTGMGPEDPGDPLKTMKVRQTSVSNTFGNVRKNADGTDRNHQGIDYYAASGTEVYAVQNGKVVKIHDKDDGDYGKYIIIQHYDKEGNPQKTEDDKPIYSFYAHLSEISVKKDDEVVENETVIGKTGNTGNASTMKGEDEHLHFEIRTGIDLGKGLDGRLDPNDYLDTKYEVDPNDSKKVIMKIPE